MKMEFNKKLNRIMTRKKNNSIYLIDSQRYNDFVRDIKEIKNKRNKEYDDYKTLASYDVLNICGKDRLVLPKTESNACIKFYVCSNELFGIIHTMHLLLNHADKDVLEKELKTKYCNVSKEVIKIYTSLCQICIKEK